MADVLIRGVPEKVLDVIKKRASMKGRSLQQELLQLLTETAELNSLEAADIAAEIRKRLKDTGRSFSDSTELLREDRDR